MPTFRLPLPLMLAFAGSRRGPRPDEFSDEHPAPEIERRHHARRHHDRDPEDEPSAETIIGFVKWSRQMLMHRVLVTSVVGALCTVAGYVLAAFLLGSRVTKLEVSAQELKGETRALRADVTALQNTDRLKTFMLCALTQRLTPDAVPSGCREYIDPPPLTPHPSSAP